MKNTDIPEGVEVKRPTYQEKRMRRALKQIRHLTDPFEYDSEHPHETVKRVWNIADEALK